MAQHKDIITPAVRAMVQKINEVGVKEIRDYCDKHKPRLNFKRQISIVRSVAQKGYVYASYDFDISRQAAVLALKRMYGIALEVEAKKDGK